jgi:hypothetical protein
LWKAKLGDGLENHGEFNEAPILSMQLRCPTAGKISGPCGCVVRRKRLLNESVV